MSDSCCLLQHSLFRVFSYEAAVRDRTESESKLESLRENVDECTSTRVDLESKLMTLRDELEFENMAHDEVCYILLFVFRFLDICFCSSVPVWFFVSFRVIFSNRVKSLPPQE